MEYIGGPDLRRFDHETALACAKTLSQIQNAYWGSPIDDGRFRRYQERINRRAAFLQDYPELTKAYQLFLARQEACPRTLCSGDFPQCNGILRDGRVYIIDWAFGGIMGIPGAMDERERENGESRAAEDGGHDGRETERGMMIKLAFKNCCMTCENVDVDYDYVVNVIGEKTVCVYCSHMNVSY